MSEHDPFNELHTPSAAAGGGVLGRLASMAVRYDEWEAVHDAVAELIAAAQPFRRDPNVLGRSEHFTTGLAVTLGQIRRLDAALSNFEGASQ